MKALLLVFPLFMNTHCLSQMFDGVVLSEDHQPLRAIVYHQESYNHYTFTNDSGKFRIPVTKEPFAGSIVIFAPGYDRLVTKYSPDTAKIFYLN